MARTDPAPVAATFTALGVPETLAAVLAERGVVAPFPIQAATLPDALAGRDVIGRGKTGSGKTIAFAVPTVSALAKSRSPRRPRSARALILLPTRELAGQVAATVAPLAVAAQLSSATVFGGVPQGPQVRALAGGVDVLIACPGRLEDLITQGHCLLDQVEVTVLDEADHMADLGFLPVVRRLLDRTPRRGQRLLFSATLDNGIGVLAERYLTAPAVHSVDPVGAPPEAMAHHVLEVQAEDKAAVVRDLASGPGRRVLFTRTKHGARKLARQLNTAGIRAVDLHGNLSQNARQRNMTAFTDGTANVLVATDIAARGIHVDEVTLVVHVDPPTEHKAYLHRSGRTARAGAAGVVVTLATADQVRDVRALARDAGITPMYRTTSSGDTMLEELSGRTTPVATQDPVAQGTTPSQANTPARSQAAAMAGRSTGAGSTAAPGRTSAWTTPTQTVPPRPAPRR